MQYKMIYGVMHYDERGDMRYEIITPMLYDTRHNKTREKIINVIKTNMNSIIENECENRFGRCVNNAPNIRDYENNPNYFLHDSAALFNQTNNLTLLSNINYSEDENELYLYGSIYEITPELFKTPESEFAGFAESKENKHRFLDEHMYRDLIFKDFFFVSRYITVPDYDFDERYEYVGGFKTISSNLYELLKKEQKDFPEQAKAFYEFSYRDAVDECPFEELRICNDMTMMAMARRYPVNLENVIRRSPSISVDDGNGYFVNCSINIVPVVSYMGR